MKYNDIAEKSTLVSKNIKVMGKRTSIRLEPAMWDALKEIANIEKCKIHDLCTLVKMRKKSMTSLTAAIRVFIMLYYRAATTNIGHERAGHGNFCNMLKRAKVNSDEQSRTLFSTTENRINGKDLTKSESNLYSRDNKATGQKQEISYGALK